MRTIFALAILLALLPGARGHDVWADGSPVPPWIKESCCGVADAHVLEPDDYSIDASGFHVRGIDMVVPLERVLPSRDGRVWAFYAERKHDALIYCVFYSGSI